MSKWNVGKMVICVCKAGEQLVKLMTAVTCKIENVLNELVDLSKGNFQVECQRG